jgi:hypothetical protein
LAGWILRMNQRAGLAWPSILKIRSREMGLFSN